MIENSDQATSVLSDKHIAILGYGNMGRAIVDGLVKSGVISADRFVVFDPFVEQSVLKFEFAQSAIAAVEKSDIILLAVKPDVLYQSLSEISLALSPSKLLISIVPGQSCQNIESAISKDARVIRAMPNTPALVNAGATAISKGSNASTEDVEIALAIFAAIGDAVVVSESHMDVVTGLSGSGPAYVYLVIEALIDGAVQQGLPRATAKRLAVQTVLGAAKMASKTELHIAALKDQVTTPGGTTITGLAKLEECGVRSAFIDAVAVATRRSAEMGKK